MASQLRLQNTLLDSASQMIKSNPSLMMHSNPSGMMAPDTAATKKKKKKLKYPLPVGYRPPTMPQLPMSVPRP